MFPFEIFIINLKHRQDRLEKLYAQLKNINVNFDLVRTVSAQYTPRNGAIGCSSSHAFALSRFLFETDSPYCLILEDDFQVNNSNFQYFVSKLNELLVSDLTWDVVLLASNQSYPIQTTKLTGLFKVLNAQTTSAYMVSRKYAPVLIKLFYDSANLMTDSYFNMEKTVQQHFYALDIIWKTEQLNKTFLAFLPVLSIQSESHSDIENKITSYGV